MYVHIHAVVVNNGTNQTVLSSCMLHTVGLLTAGLCEWSVSGRCCYGDEGVDDSHMSLTQVTVIYTQTLTLPGNKPSIFSLASVDRLLPNNLE